MSRSEFWWSRDFVDGEIRLLNTQYGRDAKALVEGAPAIIKEAVGKEAAEDIKSKVEAVGGKVTIK